MKLIATKNFKGGKKLGNFSKGDIFECDDDKASEIVLFGFAKPYKEPVTKTKEEKKNYKTKGYGSSEAAE